MKVTLFFTAIAALTVITVVNLGLGATLFIVGYATFCTIAKTQANK